MTSKIRAGWSSSGFAIFTLLVGGIILPCLRKRSRIIPGTKVAQRKARCYLAPFAIQLL